MFVIGLPLRVPKPFSKSYSLSSLSPSRAFESNPSQYITSAAFNTIDHQILLQRLEQFMSIKGTALNWFKSYFSDRFQFMQINDESSVRTKVNHGVPQGSVLGPIYLFSLYMLPLGNIIRTRSVNFHCYADDTQLYLSIKPEQYNQLTKLQACLKDIKTWKTPNFLFLNSDKTEVIILGPKHLRDTLSNDIAALDDIALSSNETVRNLGVIFDHDFYVKDCSLSKTPQHVS